jgi:hypothetical protein
MTAADVSSRMSRRASDRGSAVGNKRMRI